MRLRPFWPVCLIALLLVQPCFACSSTARVEGSRVLFRYHVRAKSTRLLFSLCTPMGEAGLSYAIGLAVNRSAGPVGRVNASISYEGTVLVFDLEVEFLGRVKDHLLFGEVDCSWRKLDFTDVIVVVSPAGVETVNLSSDLFMQFHFFSKPLREWARAEVEGRPVLYLNVSEEEAERAFGVPIDPSMEIALPRGTHIVYAGEDSVFFSPVSPLYPAIAAFLVGCSVAAFFYFRKRRTRP